MRPLRINFPLLAVLWLTAGCATTAHTQPVTVDSMSFDTPAAREVLQESLFKEDQAVLGNEEMARILSAEVVLPDGAKLAVVRFGQLPYWWGWSEDFVRMNQQIDADFLGRLRSAPRVAEVAYLPSLVTPTQMTLPHLRQAAARFQADLLLIYRTSTRSYERYKLFAEDETKAYCTVEGVLMDTRTGIIPFSTVVTQDFAARKTGRDQDFAETVAKANQQAIAKAWSRLADEVGEHLATAGKAATQPTARDPDRRP